MVFSIYTCCILVGLRTQLYQVLKCQYVEYDNMYITLMFLLRICW